MGVNVKDTVLSSLFVPTAIGMEVNMAIPQERIYTIDDIYNLPEGTRAELIDGYIYYMAPPNTGHQRISFHQSM